MWLCLGEYRGPHQARVFVRYMVERMWRERIEESYRAYVTDQLRLIPQAMFIQDRWHDLSKPSGPSKSAEEIAESVISKIGLEVVNEPA